MQLSPNTLNPSAPGRLQAAMIRGNSAANVLPPLDSLTWKSASPVPAPLSPPAPASTRCLEKGCVFPASTEGRCLQHERQAREPILFSSHQPTHVVLERGRYGPTEGELDTSRFSDRRKLAAQWEAFQED